MMRRRTRRSEDPGPPGSDDTQADPAAEIVEDPSAAEGGEVEAAGETETVHAEEQAPPIETVESMKDKWLRALAETENARKRARSDVDDARRYGTADLLRSLLPVLDNLQRALASPPAGLDPQFLEGLQLIEQQWIATMAAIGVVAVPAEIGAPLDPSLHRALLEQPTEDHPAGTIVAEIARCYRLHDRLLREGQVVVARAPDAPPAEPDPTADGPGNEPSTEP